MSASAQWVATRTTVAPARWASLRLFTLPMPGKSRVATFARYTTPAPRDHIDDALDVGPVDGEIV